MHVLNRIIQRSNRDGLYLYTKCFVSCGCGWHDWFLSESGGEDAWIDHMTHELTHEQIYDADGNLVSSHARYG